MLIDLADEDVSVNTKDHKLMSAEAKKVLFVIDTLQFGGAEKSLLENVVGFKEIIPVVCHIYPGEMLKSGFLENGIRVHSLNIHKKYGFVSACSNLKKVVQEEQPDLIVAYLTRSEITSRLVGLFNNIPVVGTFVNDLYSADYNKHLSWKGKTGVSLFKRINQLTSKLCVSFVANSASIKASNAKHLKIPLNKIKVIYRGRCSSNIRCRNFNQLPSQGSLCFLNVSRLFPVKQHRELIFGFKMFLQHCPSATLHIVGDGLMYEQLSKLIVENNLHQNVVLLGARNDVQSLLSEYDCFVFPSLVEGFSGAVVEAMFAGLPVLATDIPQNREAITHLQTGYLFSESSPEEIKKAMLWFSNNVATANTFAIRAHQYAKENFEQKKIVSQFEDYLKEIIINKN